MLTLLEFICLTLFPFIFFVHVASQFRVYNFFKKKCPEKVWGRYVVSPKLFVSASYPASGSGPGVVGVVIWGAIKKFSIKTLKRYSALSGRGQDSRLRPRGGVWPACKQWIWISALFFVFSEWIQVFLETFLNVLCPRTTRKEKLFCLESIKKLKAFLTNHYSTWQLNSPPPRKYLGDFTDGSEFHRSSLIWRPRFVKSKFCVILSGTHLPLYVHSGFAWVYTLSILPW